MNDAVHKTLTDAKGNTYRVVASWWLKALTGMALFNFIILMCIIAVVLDNMQAIQATTTYGAKFNQRNAAIADVIQGRTEANIWSFTTVCYLAERAGKECLKNPTWYADPKKYPLIANDDAGAGLFPPMEKQNEQPK